MIIGISGKIGNGKDSVGRIIQYLTSKKDNKLKIETYIKSLNPFINDGFEVKKFADTLKDIVCLLIGCTREQLEDHEFKNTELGQEWWYYKIPKFPGQADLISYNQPGLPFDWLEIANPRYLVKLTPRLLLQLLGTEAGRNIIHPNIWVNALMSNYKYLGNKSIQEGDIITVNIRKDYPNWIITDMRFPNEMEAIKKRAGLTIRVNRRFVTSDLPDGQRISVERGIMTGEEHLQLEKPHPSETALDDATFDYVIENNGTIEELIDMVKAILIKEKII